MPENKTTKTGMGLVTEVSDIQTHGDSGREFRVVNLGPKEKYSCWKPELFGDFLVGVSIEFKYTTSKDGKYKNIVSVESDGNGSRAGGNGQPTKDMLIVRQTCIKAAAPMSNPMDDNPTKKAEDTIVIAELLETWVWRKKADEPSPPDEGE